MTDIINVRNLSKHFREIRAVNDLSFSVQKGEIYGFLGQNGAGKSTTIRMLLTLIEPTEGNIEIFGYDLYKHRKEILRKTGAIIERPELYKYLTALENMRIFAHLSGIRPTDKSLIDHLAKVGLAERAGSKVKTYSQGMKQRLGIAVALVHDPDLIILDEPTNGLDPLGIADIRKLILHLSNDMGKTLLISSHLLSEIELIAGSILIIDKGSKMAEGSAKELFDPANTIVDLETPDGDDTFRKLSGSSWPQLIINRSGNIITFRTHRNKIPALARELVALDVEVLSLHARHSLEDYFLSITSGRHVDTNKN